MAEDELPIQLHDHTTHKIAIDRMCYILKYVEHAVSSLTNAQDESLT